MDELGLSAGGTDYTDRAWDALYDTVDSLRFCDEDAVLIYRPWRSGCIRSPLVTT